jgi:hypothetical protein
MFSKTLRSEALRGKTLWREILRTNVLIGARAPGREKATLLTPCSVAFFGMCDEHG